MDSYACRVARRVFHLSQYQRIHGQNNLNVRPADDHRGRVAIVLIGSNGLALDPQGRLLIAAMADRNVVRLESNIVPARYCSRTATRESGSVDPMISLGKSDGAIYFTDSVNGLRGGATGPGRRLPFNGFYLVKDGKTDPARRRSEPARSYPNGIALSPDEKHLYVTSRFRKNVRYDVLADDTMANPKRVFMDSKQRRHESGHARKSLFHRARNEIWIATREGKHGHASSFRKAPRSRAHASCHQCCVWRCGWQTLYIYRVLPVQVGGPGGNPPALI